MFAAFSQRLRQQWPDVRVPTFSPEGRGAADAHAAQLLAALGDAAHLVPQLALGADAIYLDGFAPSRNPAPWQAATLKALARLARPGATAATWCVAAEVRMALEQAGFDVQRAAGFGAKRHMLVARLAPRWPVRRHLPQMPYLGTLQWLARVHMAPGAARALGVLQLAVDDTEAAAMASACRALGLPAAYARYVDPRAASALAGLALRRGGLWVARGHAIDAGAFTRALLAAAGERVRVHCGVDVRQLVAEADGWVAQWDGGSLRAPVTVLANALDVPDLAPMPRVALRAVRGRLSLLAGAPLPPLRCALAGDGYRVSGTDNGAAAVGSTYELELPGKPGFDDDPQRAHEGNLARLRRLLGATPEVRIMGLFDALRCVSQDRLPLAGAVPADPPQPMPGAQLADLPRRAGRYCLTALGSRGLTLAPLMAELVAAQIEGEPSPLERDLLAVVDPARFALQRLRRGRYRRR